MAWHETASTMTNTAAGLIVSLSGPSQREDCCADSGRRIRFERKIVSAAEKPELLLSLSKLKREGHPGSPTRVQVDHQVPE